MANSKELACVDPSWTPTFIENLLPSAERTALLFHLSYLYLGKFPKLEQLIKERAVETQQLFSSSELILLECVRMSDDLVKSLFPTLMSAIETNNPTLAVSFLEKARAWIDNIIKAVDGMVNRYEQHNQSVAECTSNVIQEKKETENEIAHCSQEIKSLTAELGKLQEEMKTNNNLIAQTERNIQQKNSELQNYMASTSRRRTGLTIFAVLVPFFGALVKLAVDAATARGDAAHVQSLRDELSHLSNEKISLQAQEWAIQVKQTEIQLQLSRDRIKMGVIPDPCHLNEVQQCLTRIQSILIQLQNFWVGVGTLLDSLKQGTFAGEDLIEDMADLKETFLQSIETAEECWTKFGQSCQMVQGVFCVKSKDAYHFLEINPASLSQEELERESQSAMERLNKISPLPAITH